LKLNI